MASAASEVERPQAIWPWIVMPLVVLVVFCILHYDLRGPGAPAAGASTSTLSGTPDTPSE
jgi:hypothetical protein